MRDPLLEVEPEQAAVLVGVSETGLDHVRDQAVVIVLGFGQIVAVHRHDVLELLLSGDVCGELERFGDLAFVDAVEEVAVVDEKVRAAAVAVGEDGTGEVEAEGD